MSETFEYEYPRPASAADCTVFRLTDNGLELLLVKRDEDPFAGHWATPGGFVEIDETVERAAHRELQEETGVRVAHLHQFGVFSDPDRDPRGRVISNGYWALIPDDVQANAASDARALGWHPVDELPPLAFDHADLTAEGLLAIRRQARTGPIGIEILRRREPFQWEDVIDVYECVLDAEVDGGALTRAWARADLVGESDGGLRCNRAAFERVAATGLSGWLRSDA